MNPLPVARALRSCRIMLLTLLSILACGLGTGASIVRAEGEPPMFDIGAFGVLRDMAYASGQDFASTPSEGLSLPAGDAPDGAEGDFDQLTITASLPGTETQDQGGSWQRLVFQSLQDGNWEIYASDADGIDPVRLTDNDASDEQPRLTEDMSRIVFVSDRNGNPDIFSMRSDGSDVQQLTNSATRDDYPAWSPDGHRIVFSRMVDGAFDLFVMDAGGTNLTRLTATTQNDCWPSWSPDGKQIAWVTIDGANGSLIAANLDGTEIHAISSPLRYLRHPVWSPDGSQIAFDYDADYDYWIELAAIDADGTDLRTLYDAGGGRKDVWMGAWSPNGSRIVASILSYTTANGILTFNGAASVRITATGQNAVVLSGSGMDMSTDWQPRDLELPSAEIVPPPAESASPVDLKWIGSDAGPAGLAGYDVQYCIASECTWVDWLAGSIITHDYFFGQGGLSYRFRVRAIDRAGNVGPWSTTEEQSTRIESLPPVSLVAPLPAFLRSGASVAFEGWDPGGSGIASYELQSRDLAGDTWITLDSAATETAQFTGSAEHTFALRSRATDRAGNLEPFHGDGGDVIVTAYAWGARGRVLDNRDRPIAGGIIDTQPTSFAGGISDASGAYGAYALEQSEQHTVEWSKPGYGYLPRSTFVDEDDALLDIVLPPIDNVLVDSGFESEVLAQDWTPTGGISASIQADAAHTGSTGIMLGAERFAAGTQIFSESHPNEPPLLLTNRSGDLHLFWSAWGGSAYCLYHSIRSSVGTWSPKQEIECGYTIGEISAAITSKGTAHVAWSFRAEGASNSIVHHSQSIGGAGWSAPDDMGPGRLARILVDAFDRVHLAYVDPSRHGSFYRQLEPDGSWTEAESASVEAHGATDWLAVDSSGAAHLFLRGTSLPELHYVHRGVTSGWSPSEPLVTGTYYGLEPSAPVATPDGRIHILVAASGTASGRLTYLARDRDGLWWKREMTTSKYTFGVDLEVDALGRAHALWGDYSNGYLYYAVVTAEDGWQTPVVVNRDLRDRSSKGWTAQIVIDADGKAHVAWLGTDGEIHYVKQNANGQWGKAENVSVAGAGGAHDPRFVLSSDGIPQIVWVEGKRSTKLIYADPLAPDTDDSRIEQTVEIPTEMDGPTLSFFYRGKGDLNATNPFTVELQDGESTVNLFTETDANNDWTHQWVDLSAWSGRTVRLAFNVHQTAGKPSGSVDLDEVTLGAGLHTDLWVRADSAAALPGEAVTLALRYGNLRGSVPEGTTISMTLPPGLEFVAADPPSLTPGPTLSWRVDQQVEAGSGAISVEVIIASGFAIGDLVTADLAIEPPAEDESLERNTGRAHITVGSWRSRSYLPSLGIERP